MGVVTCCLIASASGPFLFLNIFFASDFPSDGLAEGLRDQLCLVEFESVYADFERGAAFRRHVGRNKLWLRELSSDQITCGGRRLQR